MKKYIFFIIVTIPFYLQAQTTTSYNLADLLKLHKIVTVPSYETTVLNDSLKKDAITTKGIVWLEGVDFKEGTIDIDLRGKDVFLKSFLGIAFYGIDTTHTEILYFRPFNFRHADTARRRWSVAYMSLPDYNFAVLRKLHPLTYENSVTPVPRADEWFHATIVIQNRKLAVFVNHSVTPSLNVTLITDRTTGKLGLYSDGLTNDFANLVISR